MDKSPDAFRTISEVADWLGVQPHVLRFWESKFTQVKPVKRAGGRRYYRPADMLLLGGIRKLLHEDGLTIKGAQKVLREDGMAHVSSLSQPLDGEDEGGAVAGWATDAPGAERVQGDVWEDAPQPAPEGDFAAEADEMPEPDAPEPEEADVEPVFDSRRDEDDAATQDMRFEDVYDDDEADAQLELPAFSARQRDDTAADEPEDEASPAGSPEPDTDFAHPAEEDPEPEASAPRPRVIDIPDPDEAAFSVAPGPLSAAFRAQSLGPEARQQLAPLVGKLAALRDRLAAERGSGPRG